MIINKTVLVCQCLVFVQTMQIYTYFISPSPSHNVFHLLPQKTCYGFLYQSQALVVHV